MFLSHVERNLIIIISMQITIVYEHNMQFGAHYNFFYVHFLRHMFVNGTSKMV